MLLPAIYGCKTWPSDLVWLEKIQFFYDEKLRVMYVDVQDKIGDYEDKDITTNYTTYTGDLT